MKFPKTPKGIYSRIEQYKKVLRSEKRKFGCYDDSYGRRLLIGPLYLLANDTDGALKYYKWYEKNFPDDSGEPFMYLCWTLTLYRAGQIEKAKTKLMRTMFSNLYILPFLFKENQSDYHFRPGSNWEANEYLEFLPVEYLAQWREEEIRWAREIYYSEDATMFRSRYVEIEMELTNERPGPRRTALVKELSAIRYISSFN